MIRPEVNKVSYDPDERSTTPGQSSRTTPSQSRRTSTVSGAQRRKSTVHERLASGKIDDSIRAVEFDGINSYFEATTFCGRAFWLTLLLISSAILAVQIYKTITDYLESPIISTFTIQTVTDLPFPVLYLCPAAAVSRSFLNQSSENHQLAKETMEDVNTVWRYVNFLTSDKHGVQFPMDKHDHPTDAQKADPQKLFFDASPPLERQLPHCEVRTTDNVELDCRSITKELFDPSYGKCYAIDLGAQRQTLAGQGLQFLFMANSDDYPTEAPFVPSFVGVRLSVQRKFAPESGDWLLLSPGSFHQIDLASRHDEFINTDRPEPQPCVHIGDDLDKGEQAGDDNNAPTFTFRVFKTPYTRAMCRRDCVAREMLDVCKCIPPIDRSLLTDEMVNNSVAFCNGQHLDCIGERIHAQDDALNRIDSCLKQCAIPCQEWRYEVRTSVMPLYAATAARTSHNVQDAVYVSVSHSHMEYSMFQQAVSMTIEDVVANLGGQIGLWLGGSILSLLQLILFLVSYCCFRANKKGQEIVKRRQSVMPT